MELISNSGFLFSTVCIYRYGWFTAVPPSTNKNPPSLEKNAPANGNIGLNSIVQRKKKLCMNHQEENNTSCTCFFCFCNVNAILTSNSLTILAYSSYTYTYRAKKKKLTTLCRCIDEQSERARNLPEKEVGILAEDFVRLGEAYCWHIDSIDAFPGKLVLQGAQKVDLHSNATPEDQCSPVREREKQNTIDYNHFKH